MKNPVTSSSTVEKVGQMSHFITRFLFDMYLNGLSETQLSKSNKTVQTIKVQ